jgi:hypothetical protein
MTRGCERLLKRRMLSLLSAGAASTTARGTPWPPAQMTRRSSINAPGKDVATRHELGERQFFAALGSRPRER